MDEEQVAVTVAFGAVIAYGVIAWAIGAWIRRRNKK